MANEELLLEVPVENYSKLQEVLKKDWPRCISGYYILGIQMDWLGQGFDYGIKIYCPLGNVWNGLVAVHDKGPFYEIFIDCPNENTKILENALRTTKKINWKSNIDIMFSPSHVSQCVKRIVDDVGVSLNEMSLVLGILDKHSPLFDISLPPEFTFKLLTGLSDETIELIDSKWPHKYAGSPNYFKILIQQGFGFGLYRKEELIAWVFIKENGALGHLYTLEEHRRKGYAELLQKMLCNRQIKAGKDIFSYVVQNNEQSLKLSKKLGFQCYANISCFGLTPKVK